MMRFHGIVADRILAEMRNSKQGNLAFIDLGKSDVFSVWRPPQPVTSPHLFLGDVFRGPPGDTAFQGAPRQPARLTAVGGDHPDLAISGKSHPPPVGRDARIDRRQTTALDDRSGRSV